MGGKRTPAGSGGGESVFSEAMAEREKRMKSYREQALKLFPWVCGRCGREFSGKRVRELTVHHRDHDHDNNPPDGSNWELLCLYCHENEHSRHSTSEWYEAAGSDGESAASTGHRPFEALSELLKKKSPPEGGGSKGGFD